MRKEKIDQKRALPWRIFTTLVLLCIAVCILGTHWHTVYSSLAVVRHAAPFWLMLALALMALTLIIASLTYGVLALHPLKLRETLLIQLAATFVGRLLPAGLGGLGLNGLYLYRRKHTAAEATAVVSVNNLIGMGAHLLLLAALILYRPGSIGSLLRLGHHSVSWIILIVASVLTATLVALPTVRRQLIRFASNLTASVKRERPGKLSTALGLAAVLTITYTALLYASARAVGVQLVPVQIFIVFSFGMLTGTATPTPGGLVGVEAGLFAGFTAYGISGPSSGAAVLVFRLVSYWMPLLPGILALLKARRLRLL